MKTIFGPFRTFWTHGTDFQGKTSPMNFWLAIWLNLIVYLLIFGYIFAYKRKYGAIFGIFVLVVYTMLAIVPLVALQIRRYHDVGLRGWWLIVTLALPSGLIAAFVVGKVAAGLVYIAGILFLVHLVILVLPKRTK